MISRPPHIVGSQASVVTQYRIGAVIYEEERSKEILKVNSFSDVDDRKHSLLMVINIAVKRVRNTVGIAGVSF